MAKTKGKIKSGLGTLIGNAGEYYVVAELLKRGIIAAEDVPLLVEIGR